MRVAFVTINGFPWGGSEVLWSFTAEHALRTGHEVLVSIFDWDKQHPQISLLKKLGAAFEFRRKFYPSLSRRLCKKAQNLFRFDGNKSTYHDYLKRFKSDHIFFNLGAGYELASDATDLFVFIKQSQIPFSIFCHALHLDCHQEKDFFERLIFVFDKARNVFFTSNSNLRKTETELGRQFENFKVLNHPLQNRGKSCAKYPAQRPLRFALPGTLTSDSKGQDLAIKALGSKRWRNREWMLEIFGDGQDRSILNDLVIELSLSEKTTFHGYYEDINAILQSCHIVLLPSRSDTGPITLFESMFAGRGIIGTPVGAMPDYVKTNVNGVLAREVSVESYAESLESAWSQQSDWAAWGQASRLIIESKYDLTPEQTLLSFLCESY